MAEGTSRPRRPLSALGSRLRDRLPGFRSDSTTNPTTALLRRRQLQIILVVATQAGLAAALAAWVARDLLHNPNPVFAPSAAVGTIVGAIGQRARRTAELLFGVGLGIVVGDALIFFIGSGPWQTGLVVTLAIAVALGLVPGGGTVVVQAGATAVLIATLSTSEQDLELPRIVDAVTGGLVGLVVVALLLPLEPIRMIRRAAAPVFHILAEQLLGETAAALRHGDADRARRALEELRAMRPEVRRLEEVMKGAEEVVTVAPLRWGRRPEFEHYARGVRHLARLTDAGRALTRRAATSLEYQEPMPPCLADAVQTLGEAVAELHRETGKGRPPESTRRLALRAAQIAGRAKREGVRTFGEAVVTQLRVAASELMRATGCPDDEAGRLVRDTARGAELGEREGQAEQEDRAERENRAGRD